HLQYEWENADLRRFFESLAQRHALIRYDRVGVGFSDRSIAEFTLTSEVKQLQAGGAPPRLRALPAVCPIPGGARAVRSRGAASEADIASRPVRWLRLWGQDRQARGAISADDSRPRELGPGCEGAHRHLRSRPITRRKEGVRGVRIGGFLGRDSRPASRAA